MAAMVSNSAKMVKDMASSNRLYAMDLQTVFKEICSVSDIPVGDSKVIEIDPVSAISVSSNRDFLNKRKVGQRPKKPNRKRSSGEPKVESQPEEPKEIEELHVPNPKWAKNLYRAIVVKTHPDKVEGKKWPALKKEKYVQVGMKALDAYSEKRFADLILTGVDIDVFSKDIGAKEQMEILNLSYSDQIKQIDSIQGSLAWRWGSFWASKDERVEIIQHLCVSSGFQPPNVEKIVEILKKLDFIN